MAESEHHEIFAIDNKKEIDKYLKERSKARFKKGFEKIEVYDSPEGLKKKLKKKLINILKKKQSKV